MEKKSKNMFSKSFFRLHKDDSGVSLLHQHWDVRRSPGNMGLPSFFQMKIREIFCKNLRKWATTIKSPLRPADMYAIISAG